MKRSHYGRSTRRRHAERRQLHAPRIQDPVPVIGRCAGCLGDIHRGASTFSKGEATYCSADCLVKGRHWVDPALCGGCGGTHRLGERP